jgi:hypothetical protein
MTLSNVTINSGNVKRYRIQQIEKLVKSDKLRGSNAFSDDIARVSSRVWLPAAGDNADGIMRQLR